MTDIAELESRIVAALDRIGTGLGALAAPRAEAPAPAPDGPSQAELDELREALETEKTANAQLEERVKSLRQQGEERLKALQAEVEAAKAAANEARNQLAQARKTAQHMQASLSVLREAAANGVVEPHLVNQAMMSELEGLRSVRDADRRELDEVMGALQPLLKEAADA